MKKILGKLWILFFYLHDNLFAVASKKDLLDSVNSYPVTAFEWDTFFAYVIPFILFIAGFLLAKMTGKKDAS